MRTITLLTIAAVTIVLLGQTPARSNDWMYRRSYFSHVPEDGESAYPVPASRSAIRPAIPQRGPGFAVRGAYRTNVYRLFNGRSYDTTVFQEFRFEASRGAR